MEITQSRLESLNKTRGLYASWAIWNPDNPADAQIIFDHCEDLKTSVVMVGLNASRAVQPWAHFRGGKHDRKLIQAFNRSSYRGSYMTDIIKGEITSKSSDITDGIRSGKIDLQKHIKEFHREMADIGVLPNALFILFGGLVEKYFADNLALTYPNYVRCRHYSDYSK